MRGAPRRRNHRQLRAPCGKSTSARSVRLPFADRRSAFRFVPSAPTRRWSGWRLLPSGARRPRRSLVTPGCPFPNSFASCAAVNPTRSWRCNRSSAFPPAPTPSRPDHQWAVVTFTVPRASIFRPCPCGTDIAAPRCSAQGVAQDLDDGTARFFLNQLWTSDRIGFEKPDSGRDILPDFGYPYTGMGWSYEWDPASPTHVGVSEYVVRPGASVQNASAMSPDQFCNGPAAPPS